MDDDIDQLTAQLRADFDALSDDLNKVREQHVELRRTINRLIKAIDDHPAFR